MRQADGEKGRTLTRGDLSDKPKKKKKKKRQPASEDTAESTEVSRGRSTEKKNGKDRTYEQGYDYGKTEQ